MSRASAHDTFWSAPRAAVALALATLCALALAAVGGGTERADAGQCGAADATIDDSVDALRNGMTCVINRERRRHDRHHLDPNGKLRTAATRHNRAMERENCFSHDCPNEPSFRKRVRRTGYLDGVDSYRIAESFGCAETPKDMLELWLDSDFNRENIRARPYRDIGVGVLRDQIGASACNTGNEVTFTVVFGRRMG